MIFPLSVIPNRTVPPVPLRKAQRVSIPRSNCPVVSLNSVRLFSELAISFFIVSRLSMFMYNSLTRNKDTYFERFPDDFDKNRFGQRTWGSFLFTIISYLWGMKTHVGWCVVMKFQGCSSFVVRKVRESIYFKKTRNYGII